jgi:hypothetical protein
MLYIASTNGMVRSIHYCMDKVVGSEISLSDNSQEKCPKCGMEDEQKSCCSDQQSIVKLDTNHHSSEIAYETPVFFLITLDEPLFKKNTFFRKKTVQGEFLCYGSSSLPIYKRDCSYLI